MRRAITALAVLALAGCGGSSTSSTSTHGAAVIPSRGSVFTDAQGRFSARFPSTPHVTTEPASIGSTRMILHIAVARDASGVTEVAGFGIRPALPSAALTPNLVAALRGVTTSSDLTLDGQPTATVFHGHPAQQASYTRAGAHQHYRAVAFFDGGSWMYLLLAPTSEFSALSASFSIVR